MSKEIKKVRVRLAGDCHVDGVACKKGDIVLINEKTETGEPFAREFGEVLKGSAPEDEGGK